MFKQPKPILEYTHIPRPRQATSTTPDEPITALKLDPLTLKAAQTAGFFTISALKATLEALTPDGEKPKGLGEKRLAEIKTALDAYRAPEPFVTASDDGGWVAVDLIAKAMNIVACRAGPSVHFHSLTIADYKGQKCLRIRWGLTSTIRRTLNLCKLDDPHFHEAPPRFAGKPDTITICRED